MIVIMPGLIKKIMKLQQKASLVLSINNRNLGYVYPSNKRTDFPLANNKLLTKDYLRKVAVPVPETFYSYSWFYEMMTLESDLAGLENFVIKPANGSGGQGIVVITRRDKSSWYSAGGQAYSLEDIKKHISDIIFGVFNHDMSDSAIIEQRIEQHEMLNAICELGLSDIRVLLYQNRPVMAMVRVPTKSSDGKANLHQGAIAMGLDLETGITTHAVADGVAIDKHPDTQQSLLGLKIPFWNEVIEMSIVAAESAPLKYLGVDIAITEQGVLMIEINARPGIEIQNVNNFPLRKALEDNLFCLKYSDGDSK